MGGGHVISLAGGDVTAVESYPSAADEWTVSAAEADAVGGNWTVTAYAICA
jgi:hypothetical protein